MLLVPGHQLHLGVSISHQKPRMLFLYYFPQCKSVFKLHNSIDTVTAGFLKCLVNVFKLWEPQNKDIIRDKPSVTPILLAAILWPTRVITDRVCKPRSDWLELCYFHHDFSSHLVRRVGHVLLKSGVTSQKAMTSRIELHAMRCSVTIGASVKPRVFGVMNAGAAVEHRFTIRQSGVCKTAHG